MHFFDKNDAFFDKKMRFNSGYLELRKFQKNFFESVTVTKWPIF